MNRSLVLPALVLMSSLIGCRAQEDRKTLQNSVTRLEQRLVRMDEYLKSLQQGEADKRAQHERQAQERDAELQQLRELLAQHERQAKDRAQAAERQTVEMDRQRAKVQEQFAKERAAAEKQLADERTQLQRQVESERAALREEVRKARQAAEQAEVRSRELAERQRAELQRAQERQGDRDGVVEKLAAERREVEKLRAAVQQDVLRAREAAAHTERAAVAKAAEGGVAAERRARVQAEETERLRVQNERLKNRLADLERELAARAAAHGHAEAALPAAAAPGSIVVNNEDGQVHFHFHGPTPHVVMPKAAPAPTSKPNANKAEGSLEFLLSPKSEAAPSKPKTDATPKTKAKAESLEKKINE
jgi:hypothetical protein